MCVHKGTVLLVLVVRFLLCYCCFMGKWKKHQNRRHMFLRGGSYVVLLVNTNMCVARHMMLMMLLQLPGFWSWAGAAAVVVAVGCGFQFAPKQGPR